MSIKSKTAGRDPAVQVDMKSTAHNYQQYNIGFEHLFLCDSISSQKGGHDA